jgi:DNA-binding MarR family transcriptional regulator
MCFTANSTLECEASICHVVCAAVAVWVIGFLLFAYDNRGAPRIVPHNDYPQTDYNGTMAGRLKREIKQKRPFSSVQEEVVLSIMRTADQVAVPMNEVLRGAGLSPSQYNVLRILRGAGEEGQPCGEISERMVRRDPDLTRLLDRLEASGLVTRTRDTRDRRIIRASITAQGAELLASLDEEVEASIRRGLAHVPVARLRTLLELLEEVRAKPGE